MTIRTHSLILSKFIVAIPVAWLLASSAGTWCRGADALQPVPTNTAAPGGDPAPPRIVIDAGIVREPMSENVYSQFIEHLGRCIYGGIWAEMLEDRKFYFPITADYAPYKSLKNSAFPVVGASPWEIIGDADGVTMEKKDAFVGEHSPRIRAGSGVRQHDLGVAAGKSYVGYVWANPLAGRAEMDVTLAWGDATGDRATAHLVFSGAGYSKQTFTFTAARATDKAS